MNRVLIHLPNGPTLRYAEQAIVNLREREVGKVLPIRSERVEGVVGYGRVVAVETDERGPYLELEVEGDLAATMYSAEVITGIQEVSIQGSCPSCGATHPASNVREIITDGGRGFSRCRDLYHNRRS